MSGDRFERRLADVAVGRPAGAELESHLADCARCRALLDGQRRLTGRIDRELSAALDVTPSAAFLSRARVSVLSARRAARPGSGRWLAAAAVVTGVLAAGDLLRERDAGEAPPPRAAAAPVRPDPQAPARSPAERPVRVPAPRAVVTPRASRPTDVVERREPEVLVASNEAAALRGFYEARLRIEGGAAPREVTLQPGEPMIVATQLTDLVLGPIEIPPLSLDPKIEE
jgi:hypothetical protein